MKYFWCENSASYLKMRPWSGALDLNRRDSKALFPYALDIGVPDARKKQEYVHFSICACHPCAGAMLILLCIVPILTDDSRRESARKKQDMLRIISRYIDCSEVKLYISCIIYVS